MNRKISGVNGITGKIAITALNRKNIGVNGV